MLTVNVHEAKSQLSKLLEAVEAGQEVTIARAGRPVARLVGLVGKPPRHLGALIGKLNIPEDFDDPLPEPVLALFRGPLDDGFDTPPAGPQP
ncbi:MAG: type II toxin-antitoxin system Phd/YefM family antitoxin [Aquabacterium sp.]|nr:type II toxin-antitoxin system Phd/YefM family antitoxin [Aquabacterium sp.]